MMTYMCPVCGFNELKEPAYSGELGSLDICQSCGYQYGFTDDDLEISHEAWRAQWIQDGMQWSIEEIAKPPFWNPRAQLRRIGVVVE